jgi:hypothetical protein
MWTSQDPLLMCLELALLKSIYFLIVVLGMIGIAQGTTPQAEQDAFVAAIHRKEPQAKAAALESFLNKFPASSLKERSLEVLIQAYWEIQNPKFGNTLDQLLRLNPDNLFGLTLKADLRCDNEPRPGLCEAEEMDIANRGLRVLETATRPADMSEEDFVQRKAHGSAAFHRTLGIWAVVHHDYQGAQVHLRAAEELDPTNFACVYPLGLAYMKADPPNNVQGLFFIARATSLAHGSTQKMIADYGRTEYVKYHGSEKGWTELLKLAKTLPTTPAGFTIIPASKTP